MTRKERRAMVRRFKSYLNAPQPTAGNGKTQPRSHHSGSTDAGSKFDGGTADLLGTVDYDHNTLRGKSRKAVFDSPPMATIQQRKVQSVVDTGIRVDPTPDLAEIGLTEEQGAAFIRYAQRFNDWMGWKSQHRREQMTFFQAQALAQTEKVRDGEYFFRLYYNYEDALPHPLQWEALDADQIKDWTTTYTQDGYAFTEQDPDDKDPADGIVKDDRGRPVEYLVCINKNNSEVKVVIKAKTDGGRFQILHGFTPEYSFQTRGFPANAKILQDSHLLQQFSLANINKAINQSQRVFSVYNKDQDPTSPFDEGEFEAALGRMFEDSSIDGSNPAETEEAVISYLNSPTWKTVALATQPGSSSLIMPEKGTDIKSMDNTAPVNQYDVFVGAYFSFLAAAENVPIEVALMKFGQNYSASRAALIMYFRICEVERQDMDADLIGPCYEMYLAEGIATGQVAAPGWTDQRLRRYYCRHRTIGAPLISIDPARESVAVLNQIGVAGTSFSRSAENLNGSDFEKNLSENEGFVDRINRLRLGLGLNKGGA